MKYINYDKEIKNLDLQIITSSIFIITTIISILLTIDQKNYIKYNKYIIFNDKFIKILKTNRKIIVVLLAIFVYINYKNKQFNIENNKENNIDNIELSASILSFIAGLTSLYAIKFINDNEIITDNPST